MGAPALAATEKSAGAAGGAVPLAPPDRQPPELPLPELPGRKVGWAIVGLGELALGEIMPAFARTKHSKPVALVSGHPDKAKRVAEAYGIENDAIYDYENFDRLAEDKRVEVVYIVLPNSMHAEFTIRALRAGKHVLCEKPMAVTVEECTQMIDAAKSANRILGVAYRLHSEPMNRKVMEMCARKEFGEIKTFESSNCQDVKAPNIRLSAELGGGPVGDVGVYSINAARYVTNEEPVEVTAIAHQPKDDPRFREVPESVAFTLRYPSGVLAHCDCSFGTAESRRYRVHCAKGWIEMDPAFSYRGLRLRTKGGDAKKGDAQAAEHFITEVNHFTEEMDHFSDCVLNGTKLRTPGEMGLADMRIAVAIDEAVRTGKAVKVQG
jgi:predicted dehydrogenase